MELNILMVRAEGGFEQNYGKYVRYISDVRAARIERMRSEKQKTVSLFTELLIRYRASQTLKIPAEKIVISLGEHGKPEIEGYDDYHFSVSHAGGYIAFVSDSVPVGVDIENTS
jgi:4'-phosphopantetheinyl transferase